MRQKCVGIETVGPAGLSEGGEASHKWLGAAVRGQSGTTAGPMRGEVGGERLIGDEHGNLLGEMEKAKAPMTKTITGAFRGLRRFQFFEPIASPKTLVESRVSVTADEKIAL